MNLYDVMNQRRYINKVGLARLVVVCDKTFPYHIDKGILLNRPECHMRVSRAVDYVHLRST